MVAAGAVVADELPELRVPDDDRLVVVVVFFDELDDDDPDLELYCFHGSAMLERDPKLSGSSNSVTGMSSR